MLGIVDLEKILSALPRLLLHICMYVFFAEINIYVFVIKINTYDNFITVESNLKLKEIYKLIPVKII